MYHRLVNRCTLTSGAVAYSRAVSMEGANSIQADIDVTQFAGTSITIQAQVGNDLDNWSDQGSSDSVAAVGSKLLAKVTGIAMAYVRLRYTHAGTGTCVFGSELNTSLQH